MNLPNKLTVLRTAMVPFFLVFLLIDAIPNNYLWACIIFAVASFTDFLDGNIARKHNLVTNFGKFLDPLADKILVTCAIVAFVTLGLASPIAVIIIIARDYIVSALRLIAVSSNGKVIAANWWGKVKTALQMISIVAILLVMHLSESAGFISLETVRQGSNIVMWILAAFTGLSGIVYLKQNISLLSDAE
ncbi:MAG: CDP-diacylglycerol--glycerol-3-phosphate 3-phosphatidyltransferase [Oscillospiraceae bacterium]